jgi:hypothetical protein
MDAEAFPLPPTSAPYYHKIVEEKLLSWAELRGEKPQATLAPKQKIRVTLKCVSKKGAQKILLADAEGFDIKVLHNEIYNKFPQLKAVTKVTFNSGKEITNEEDIKLIKLDDILLIY